MTSVYVSSIFYTPTKIENSESPENSESVIEAMKSAMVASVLYFGVGEVSVVCILIFHSL